MRISWRSHRDGPVDCRTVRKLMQSFLDGELPPSDMDRVAAHLADCERCGVDAAVTRRVIASIAALRSGVDPERLDRLAGFVETVAREGAPPA